MICFRDRSYCANGEECSNRQTCSRWFGPKEQAAAAAWWGDRDGGAPVAFMEFKQTCPDWSPR